MQIIKLYKDIVPGIVCIILLIVYFAWFALPNYFCSFVKIVLFFDCNPWCLDEINKLNLNLNLYGAGSFKNS